ncbi:MAG: mechanosensitive ion channel [Planctomycetota bacterium]|nr:MAG: mechanosensitive ion channel [Planctomycetota bacterium]
MFAVSENWEGVFWLLAVSLAAGLIGHYLIFKILLKITGRTKNVLDNSLVKHCYRPLLWFVIVLIIRSAILVIEIPEQFEEAARHLISLFLIGIVGWLVIKAAYILEDCIVSRFKVDEKDNLQARKIHTQLRVIKRIVTAAVIILVLGTMLMTFEQVRQLGKTILASAGIIGIVVGLAAQRTIGNFIAGLQIAFTQPIRVDDVVIVENEWGRIEEITLTYVVVRIWDLRRLILPINYFIEKPFQNWTRTTADILGTVFIYVDYSVPVAAIREQLQKILNESELWDKKVCVLQVTNASEKTIELRALMSAADASTAWSLRCEVREKLIEFVRTKYPRALPKLRAEFTQLKDS